MLKTLARDLLQSSGVYRPIRTIYLRLFQPTYYTKLIQGRDIYSKLLEPDSLCFDVGANIGEIAEILLESNLRVVAFEPQPDCLKKLEARCKHFRDRLTIKPVAVGAECKQTTLYVHTNSLHSTLDQTWEAKSEVSNTIQIPMTTLDRAILDFGKPSYCKVDVEGWEFEVLKGLTQLVPLISFEYHLWESNIDKTIDCLNYLANFGKQLFVNITPAETLRFEYQEWMPLKEFLSLFPETFRSRKEFSYGDIFIRTC
ncbi:MAG: FkbM family methyltransferase [Xenococcaceae cyanobacterium]